jgi:hypothetical protein
MVNPCWLIPSCMVGSKKKGTPETFLPMLEMLNKSRARTGSEIVEG